MDTCQASTEGTQTPHGELGLSGWNPIVPPLLSALLWKLLELRMLEKKNPETLAGPFSSALNDAKMHTNTEKSNSTYRFPCDWIMPNTLIHFLI